jgi:tetratricopeptide (TPR) repeat protein
VSQKLQKQQTNALKEKTQYGLTFGVIATMLFVAGFPTVVIFFFGVFAYFLWKTFSQPTQQGVRQVFEFYLSANEILRNDERSWFGFEVQEVIMRGEQILHAMHGAPPLVYFTLGALYNKIGNHELAVNHLSYVVENDSSDESTYVHPSADLRNYVKVLRKIEREPNEAPQTSAAIRSLERARKNRGAKLLEQSRTFLDEIQTEKQKAERKQIFRGEKQNHEDTNEAILKTVHDNRTSAEKNQANEHFNKQNVRRKPKTKSSSQVSNNKEDMFANRKPITEVLHDIYDKNIQ